MEDISTEPDGLEPEREPFDEREFVLLPLAETDLDGLAIHESGRIVFANQALGRLCGYAPGELLAVPILDLIAPDSRALFSRRESDERGCRYEALALRRDGQPVEVELSATSVRFQGRPCRLASFRDIREPKRSRQALEEIAYHHQTLMDTCPDAIVLSDLQGRMLVANEQAARAAGCASVDEFLALGRNVFDIVVPEERDRVLENTRKVLAGQTIRAEYEITRKDGNRYPVEISSSLVRDAAGEPRGFLGIVREISERKKAEQEQERLREKIRQAQKLESLGVLAGGIAHDFNSLLLGIVGNASLARTELPPESASRSHVEQIEKIGLHAAELTRQLLAFAGKGSLYVEACDLSGLAQETVDLLRVSIPARVELRLELARPIPLIEADPVQLRQVIMNLVYNAAEATSPRGGWVTIRTGEGAAPRDDPPGCTTFLEPPRGSCVFLEVSDEGCGMDEPTLRRIFDPFFSTKRSGRGLGLAVLLGIVRRHTGAVQVCSQPGRGSTFRVVFCNRDQRPSR